MLKPALPLALLLCFVQAVSGLQCEWTKVAPAGGGFSVMMPARPEEELKPGDGLTTHLFTVTTDDALYIVAYGDYAPIVRMNVDEELTANRDRFLKGVNATLISTRQITLDGRKGIEFTGESDQAAFKSRIFMFGIRIHQIAVAVFKGKEASASANRFFSSFEFTKGEKLPRR